MEACGSPLDRATRMLMESRFGYDFGGVRIHTDGRAAASAQALRAQVYTLGRHIVFGREQPPAATPEGRRLVAHELTHIRDRVSAGEPPAPPLISDALAQGLRSRLRLDPTDPAVWTGTGARTIEQIIRWYTNIRTVLASGAIRYTCLGSGCEGGDWGYTEEDVPRWIHLCQPFWTSSEDEQALTLIHETVHLYHGLEDTGRGAGNTGCLEEFVSVVNAVNIPAFVVCPPPPTP